MQKLYHHPFRRTGGASAELFEFLELLELFVSFSQTEDTATEVCFCLSSSRTSATPPAPSRP